MLGVARRASLLALNQRCLLMRLALYQPDIPQNTGTLIRLSACLGVPLDIIEPCGFTFTDKQLRRAAMDYAPDAAITRHDSWSDFVQTINGRLVLATTKSEISYADFVFQKDDIILLGREQAGVPQEVHDIADKRLLIPMQGRMRSINVAIAGAMILGEGLRQLCLFPHYAEG